jgi:cysteine-rich repeat protein
VRPLALLLVVAMVALAGCVQSRVVACDGYVCPVGNVCDDARGGCVLAEQVAACEGAADRTSCSFPGEASGSCDRGVCYHPVCGNGRTEGDELCDDGNTAGGDGCNASCDSDEACGNHIVDGAAGEECDDGNFVSHDGCSSACTAEVPTWSQLADPRHGLHLHQLADDVAHARLIAFGGLGPGGETISLTLELVVDTWVPLTTAVSPPPRTGHVLVYDAALGRVVLFGGTGPMGESFGDTWTLDDERWQEAHPPSSPSARAGAAAACDGGHAELVLFGGGSGAAAGETWTYDGTTWTLRHPSRSPPPRRDHVMAYDAARARVVLFGGAAPGGAALVDTWEWDGTTWIDATPATTPAARGTMTYDASAGHVVLYGGRGTPAASTWVYDGNDWRELPAGATDPIARRDAAITYDSRHGRVVLLGGASNATDPSGTMGLVDSWELVGDTWHEIVATLRPPQRVYAGMVYDAMLDAIVYFGGNLPLTMGHIYDTWLARDSIWRAAEPEASPAPPGDAPGTIVYDPARGLVLMARPTGMGMPFETWSYDGHTWTRLALASSPMPRAKFALAFDRGRGRAVLFGGEAGMSLQGDTWELDLDAGTWVHVETGPASAGPSARSDAIMAYDGARVVLFGGRTGPNVYSDETWAWDGAAWTQLAPAMRPPARGGATLTFDEARGHLVLFGGDSGGAPMADLWELDNAGWHPLTVTTGPAPTKTARLVYEPPRQRFVLETGDPAAQTWELRWSSTILDEACAGGADDDGDGLVDCDDPDCALLAGCQGPPP